MNIRQNSFNFVKLNSFQTNQSLAENQKKNGKAKVQNFDNQKGRNTRSFGVDITNNQNSYIDINKFPIVKEEVIKKQSLSRKGSTSSRKITNKVDIKPKKNIKGVPDLSIDDSAKNLKKEIHNNSFGGSSMIVDEPIMTRNQISEKLNNNNPQLVLEYLENILKDFYQTEYNPNNFSFYPYGDYMKIAQKDINDKMRVILFDWLVDVHLKWRLRPDTLFITFNIIDRFLGLKETPRDELQCVGVASLLIACKYEEIYFPDISDFQEITDNAFSKQEILKKEIEILAYLKYDLTFPTSLRFFEVFNVYLKLEGKDKSAILFLLELCTFEYSMLKYKPSLVATGCTMLIISNNKQLKEQLFYITRYSNEEIESFIKDLYLFYCNKQDNGSKSIKRKFSQTKFQEISKIDVIDEYLLKRNNLLNHA